MKFLLLLASMSLAVLGQFSLKKGVITSDLSPNFFSIIKTIFSPNVFLGLACYGLSTIFWLFVLQKFDLSIAYPSLALTYIVIVFLSAWILHEPITLNKVFGVIFIFIGICLLNINSK